MCEEEAGVRVTAGGRGSSSGIGRSLSVTCVQDSSASDERSPVPAVDPDLPLPLGDNNLLVEKCREPRKLLVNLDVSIGVGSGVENVWS